MKICYIGIYCIYHNNNDTPTKIIEKFFESKDPRKAYEEHCDYCKSLNALEQGKNPKDHIRIEEDFKEWETGKAADSRLFKKVRLYSEYAEDDEEQNFYGYIYNNEILLTEAELQRMSDLGNFSEIACELKKDDKGIVIYDHSNSEWGHAFRLTAYNTDLGTLYAYSDFIPTNWLCWEYVESEKERAKRKYEEAKEKIKEEAIEWQLRFSEVSKTYKELAEEQARFEKLAKRYGLVSEFKANGII